jgi:hypothetical protein
MEDKIFDAVWSTAHSGSTRPPRRDAGSAAAQQPMPFPGSGDTPPAVPAEVYVSAYLDRMLNVDDRAYTFHVGAQQAGRQATRSSSNTTSPGRSSIRHSAPVSPGGSHAQTAGWPAAGRWRQHSNRTQGAAAPPPLPACDHTSSHPCRACCRRCCGCTCRGATRAWRRWCSTRQPS